MDRTAARLAAPFKNFDVSPFSTPCCWLTKRRPRPMATVRHDKLRHAIGRHEPKSCLPAAVNLPTSGYSYSTDIQITKPILEGTGCCNRGCNPPRRSTGSSRAPVHRQTRPGSANRHVNGHECGTGEYPCGLETRKSYRKGQESPCSILPGKNMVYSKKQRPIKVQEMAIIGIGSVTTLSPAVIIARRLTDLYCLLDEDETKNSMARPYLPPWSALTCPSRVGDKDSPDSSAWNGDQTAALHGSVHMKVIAYQNFRDGQMTFSSLAPPHRCSA